VAIVHVKSSGVSRVQTQFYEGGRAVVVAVSVGTALLCLAALYNRYPLVFPDTGTYLKQALERMGAVDRPPYYSLLILPFHLGWSLWPIVVMQSLVTVLIIHETLKLLFGADALKALIPVCGSLALLTSLPWHTGQVMPDISTALLFLTLAIAALRWHHYQKIGKVVLWLTTAGLISLHYGNWSIAIAYCVFLSGLLWFQSGTDMRLKRFAVVSSTAVAAATLAFLTYSMVLIKRPTISPMGSIFLFARVVADGPGRMYLKSHCPALNTELCNHLDKLPETADEMLWEDVSPLRLLSFEQLTALSGKVVAGTLVTYPLTQLGKSLANAAQQLVMFETADTLCPEKCLGHQWVRTAVEQHFNREYPSYLASRQITGTLPVKALRMVHTAVIAITAIVLLWVMLRSARRDDTLSLLTVALLVGIVLNAAVTGALSGPHDRYQSRVIWLIPMLALFWVGRLRFNWGRSG
jgi:hypothetical protein